MNKFHFVMSIFIAIILSCMLCINILAIIKNYKEELKCPLYLNFAMFIITSNEMRPYVNENDLAIVKSDDITEFSVGDSGDIIIFINNGYFMIGRLTDKFIDSDGSTKYVPSVYDNSYSYNPIDKNSIIGKVIFNIPKLGILILFLQNHISLLILLFVLILLMVIVEFIIIYNNEKRTCQE